MSPIRIQPANGGAVFHPDHDELHGFTVVLEGECNAFVGRWDHQTPDGVIVLKGGRRHCDGEGGQSVSDFIAHTAQFGFEPAEPHMEIPAAGVSRICRLGDLQRELRGF